MSGVHLPCFIRLASATDLEAINCIYNHYVDQSTCTYAEQHSTPGERREWFDAHDAAHPITVAEANGQVVGWGSLSKFHGRCAYRFTVENSVYIDCRFLRRGLGGRILGDLIQRARAAGHHTMIAGIDGEQAGSLSIHERFGFQKVGRLTEAGFKFGRWLDVVYMQLMLEKRD